MMKFNISILSLFILLLSMTTVANNVRINGKLVPVMNGDGLVQLNFSVSWDNAWNDPYNWDAVWVFVKYHKKNDTGAWKHGYLATSGHVATDLNVCLGDNNGLGVGAFLFPQANGNANVVDKGVSLVLSRDILNTITAEQITSGSVDFSVQLMEMVLIPESSFYAGDGLSANRLADPVKNDDPVLVDGELKEIMMQINTEKTVVAEKFPKGYQGIYAMKYELSQAQYADFLNKLSRPQQEWRISNLSTLKNGEFIFGDKNKPTARNGIVVYMNEPDRPVVFAHNLTLDDSYNAPDDGQTLACNFISLAEMLNYCDWTGLRPMSELEFEKACRKPFPELPVPGEKAWNTADYANITSETDLINARSESEYAVDANKNVNSGNKIGPLRCGVFASNPSVVNRITAGATCSGLLEMSGNLREMCYEVQSGYKYVHHMGEYLGNGELNQSGLTDIPVNYWPQSGDNFILKGGGYISGQEELRVSDRSMVGHVKSNMEKDSTVGFRAVRNVPAPEAYVDPGKVVGGNGKLQDTLCSLVDVRTYQVLNDALASLQGQVNGVHFNYQWYIKKGATNWEILKGENNPTLNYQDAFVNTTDQALAYQFRRDVIFPGGTISSSPVQLWILNIDVEISGSEDRVDGCDIAQGITITSKTNSKFTWMFNGRELLRNSGVSSSYKAKRADFKGSPDASPYQIVCDISAGSCVVSKLFSISVETATTDPANCPCGSTITDEDDQEYPTIQIGGQCWMTKNLNKGFKADLTKSEVYKLAGIQKYCYADNNTNCSLYGGMYEWWEVLCGGQCAAEFNTAGNAYLMRGKDIPDPGSGNNPTLEKLGIILSSNGKFIRGICPQGWHLPSDGEWKVLETSIGMPAANIGGLTWGRGGAVRKLMTYDGYGEDAWCLNSDCNETGFSAYFGGYIERTMNKPDVTASDTKYIRWWTASHGGTNAITTKVRGISMDPMVVNGITAALPAMGSHVVGRNSAVYVRCLKDY